jgi:hypothetical protein
MRNADHRRFGHARISHGQVLDIDRTDPFATRFDDVLAAIGEANGVVVIKTATSPLSNQPSWSRGLSSR